MRRALIILLLLAPLTLLFLLPLYTIGAVASVVWFSLSVGWDIGIEQFHKFVCWARAVIGEKGK